MWWGAEVAHEEGTSSCAVPVRSRSKSLVCSWDAKLSVFTLNSTGPSWSSAPTKLKCSWNRRPKRKCQTSTVESSVEHGSGARRRARLRFGRDRDRGSEQINRFSRTIGCVRRGGRRRRPVMGTSKRGGGKAHVRTAHRKTCKMSTSQPKIDS